MYKRQVKKETVADTAAEMARFEAAKEKALGQLKGLYEKALKDVGEEEAMIFDVHQMLLDDPDYNDSIKDIIENEKKMCIRDRGIYIPLIVVNCIILGRAEAYASQNPPFLSVMDGVGMGLGFTIALLLIGMVRELVGAGTLFGMQVTPEAYNPIGIFVKAPGAFLVLAFLVAIMNAVGMKTLSLIHIS